MSNSTPIETVRAFAKTIHAEASKYGFDTIDFVRLINELMDLSTDANVGGTNSTSPAGNSDSFFDVSSLPLRSQRLTIRMAEAEADLRQLKKWMDDEYGRHFLMSCATAQRTDLDALLENPHNEVGIILQGDEPIGAVAYLDIDRNQKKAELRKLIGSRDARGKGFAEEATRLWIKYGKDKLGLDKVYVSTLQANLRNIRLNESIGFRVEGVLHSEVLIGNVRYDVLRMGLCLT